MQPESGPIENERECPYDDETEDDDVEPAPGDGESADRVEPASHPARVRDLLVGRPEDRADRLLQDQADAPGSEQGLERPSIEKTDYAALEHDANRSGEQKRHRYRDQQIGIDPAGRQEAAEQLLTHVSGVGAEHDHLAV